MKAIIYPDYTEIYPTREEVFKLCKPGSGADTCIWLVGGAQGFECTCLNRPWQLVKLWEQGQTTAKRDGCTPVLRFEPSEVDFPALPFETQIDTHE